MAEMYEHLLSVESLEEKVGGIVAEEERAQKQLFTHDGRPIFVPDEHRQRHKAIEDAARQKLYGVADEAIERAERYIAEAEREMYPLTQDPVYGLGTIDLGRAANLRAFVEEDLSHRTPEELVEELNRARVVGDAVQCALVIRWTRRNLDTLRQQVSSDAVNGRRANYGALHRLEAALNALEESRVDDATRKKLEAARRKREVASQYKHRAERVKETNSPEWLQRIAEISGTTPDLVKRTQRDMI